MNGKLREAITASGIGELEIGRRLGVDLKTVERRIGGRLPYPRYRRSLAELLDADEAVIWPYARRSYTPPAVQPANVEGAYAHRWAVPREAWLSLFSSADREIEVLAYAALFLAEDKGITRVFADKARAGIRVRILLGFPEGFRISMRGKDERIGNVLTAKIRNALALFRPLVEIGGVQIRLHDTTLYASIYRSS